MASKPKTLADLEKQRALDDKVENFVANVKGAVKNVFKTDTTREKVVKGSLAAVFLLVGTPYLVQEITETEDVRLFVKEKQIVQELHCTTLSERFTTKRINKNADGKASTMADFSIIGETAEIDRDCSTKKTLTLRMDDGRTYEVEPNFMQGFSQREVDSMWDALHEKQMGYFTTSTTITGRNVITDYSRHKKRPRS